MGISPWIKPHENNKEKRGSASCLLEHRIIKEYTEGDLRSISLPLRMRKLRPESGKRTQSHGSWHNSLPAPLTLFIKFTRATKAGAVSAADVTTPTQSLHLPHGGRAEVPRGDHVEVALQHPPQRPRWEHPINWLLLSPLSAQITTLAAPNWDCICAGFSLTRSIPEMRQGWSAPSRESKSCQTSASLGIYVWELMFERLYFLC